MNKPYGVPGGAGRVSPGPHGYGPIHGPHGYGPVPAYYPPRVIVEQPVPGRPMTRVYSNTQVKLSRNDGLIVTGGILIAMGLVLAFAAPPVPEVLALIAALSVLGIVLVGLGIFFKTREKPPKDSKPLASLSKAKDEVKGKDNRYKEGIK